MIKYEWKYKNQDKNIMKNVIFNGFIEHKPTYKNAKI